MPDVQGAKWKPLSARANMRVRSNFGKIVLQSFRAAGLEDSRPNPYSEEAWGCKSPHRSILRVETVPETILLGEGNLKAL